MEHSGVAADLTAMAKSLAGGLPLGAVTGRAEIMDAPVPAAWEEPSPAIRSRAPRRSRCSTCCATSISASAPRRSAAWCGHAFLAWRSRHGCIGDVRGLGAMQAMELVTPSGAPDGARAAAVQREAAMRDLLVLTAGMSGDVIRMLMPLTIPRDVLQRGLDILEAALVATEGSIERGERRVSDTGRAIIQSVPAGEGRPSVTYRSRR